MNITLRPTKHSILSDIFGVSTVSNSINGRKVTFLKSIEDFKDLTLIDIDSVDPIINYQLSENANLLKQLDINGSPYESAIDYLFSCFKRLHLNRINPKNGHIQDLDYFGLERVILSYTNVVLQINEFTIHGDKKKFIQSLIKWNGIERPDLSIFIQKIFLLARENEELLEVANAISGALIVYIKFETMSQNKKAKEIANKDNVSFSEAIVVIEENTRITEAALGLFQLLTNDQLYVQILPSLGTFDPINMMGSGTSIDPEVKKNISMVEKYSLLGVLLSCDISSIFNPLTAAAVFSPCVMIDEEVLRNDRFLYDEVKDLKQIIKTNQASVTNLQFAIIDKIIRNGKQTRQIILKWFASLLNYNGLRTSEHNDPDSLGCTSDSLMINISLLFMKFAGHFIDNKFDKIDPFYVLNKHAVALNLEDETKMNAENTEWNEECKKNQNNLYEPNFMTECFFLCSGYMYYGIGGTIIRDSLEERKCNAIKDAIEKMDEALEKQKSNIFAKKFIEEKKQKIQADYKVSKSKRMAFETFVLNQEISGEIFTYISGACKFLLRCIDPTHQYPNNIIQSPLINERDPEFIEKYDDQVYLRSKAPIPFKYFPVTILEGILKYCNIMVRFVYSPMREHAMIQPFLDLATVLLRNNELLSNPHIKSDLITVVAICSAEQKSNSNSSSNDWFMDEDKPGFMINEIISNKMANDSLLYGLLDFYIKVEKTGGSNEFYDKFNSRYYISMILEQLYKIPFFKQQLMHIALSNEYKKFFTTLIARMLNDLTFLLDESFAGLTEVHNCYLELQKRIRGEPSTTEESMEDLRSRLNKAASRAESCIGLANLSMSLFRTLTRDIPQCFTIPELVDRLAGMLNYNLNMLVGPQCKNLIVKNPEKYKFDPKTLLKDLCSIYINLSNEQSFIIAAAKDERSFDPNLFEQAIRNLHNRLRLIDDDFAENIRHFVHNVQEEKLVFEQFDVDMSDCPDEFLDPLMYIVMEDPVILPRSRISIDKKTIQQHLLNDPTDPFNRTPLKFEEVIPDTELKAKIDAYKREKSRQRLHG
ncbi:hypothetical protein FOG51_03712 [Hanseniaspora uvarum]|nr:hypothetical protein FOG48_00981 [Hanseniaspora uvarum]KAF0271211.1 hypothetical protein FOG51_03712 [Hanseniaspora uvarum]KAF0276226.1 hypothetical protein FOG50_02906 [Hanseniaspora uvarum]